MDAPLYIDLLFIFLILVLLFLLFKGLHQALEKQGNPKKKKILLLAALGLAVWMALLAVLSYSGFFTRWDTVPPRLMILLVVPTVVFIFLIRSRRFNELIRHAPQQGVLYAQSFRIYIEGILWLLFIEGLIPVQMTFEGLNFDVLTGLSAPVMAYVYFKKKGLSRRMLIVWNYLGLALVTIILTIAILSTPTVLRLFDEEPANRLVIYLPYIWLPGFVVPMAYFLHIVSLKWLYQNK